MGSKHREVSSFNEMYEEEKQLLERLRKGGKSDGLAGLALSGGGIRSATFNLGVLQGLAELGFLKKFDYLSTVSGGGYIGSWLSSLIHWQGQCDIGQIELDIAPRIDGQGNPEDAAVTFLRNYSNYLTPKASLFSIDTLAAFTTYFRNVILNQAIVLLTLTVILLTPRLVQKMGEWLETTLPHGSMLIAVLLLIINIGLIGFHLGQVKQHAPADRFRHWLLGTYGVIALIAVPLLVAAWLSSFSLLRYLTTLQGSSSVAALCLGAGTFYLFLWTVGYKVNLLSKRPDGSDAEILDFLQVEAPVRGQLLQIAGFTFLAGSAGGGLLWVIASLIDKFYEGQVNHWLATMLGTPLMLVVFSLTVVLHTGLIGRLLSEDQREWWSRFGALMLTAILIWLSIFGIAFLGPSLLICLSHYDYISLLGPAGWLLTTVGGVLAGKSAATDSKNPKSWLELLARYAPYVFIFGLLAAISLVIQVALSSYPGASSGDVPTFRSFYGLLQQHSQVKMETSHLVATMAVLGGMACLLAWRVNLNVFSLHQFYRYRLTRAYLGATNKQRDSHPFTGFDKGDDLPLNDLQQRPYPIINTAINFTSGGQLAWQDRKAASFVFTPLFTGYQIPDPKAPHDPARDHCYYRPTALYAQNNGEGLSLGRAMAISGAASSPNMGYHSSPATAFLLTLFNVRLGRWCGNTKHPSAWKETDPKFGLRYLVNELLGLSKLDSAFVNLSDGGHFENTAIYELVRRKCRFIVVGDAGADPNRDFEDLGNAVRKCRVDFGVEININLAQLAPVGEKKRSSWHYAEGTIDYGAHAPGLTGKLIVLKPSLSLQGDEPADILNYADSNPDFPQQPTSDQWFDEAQFESYRKLGYHTVMTAKDTNCKVLQELMLWSH